jgi:hypothetical protein
MQTTLIGGSILASATALWAIFIVAANIGVDIRL